MSTKWPKVRLGEVLIERRDEPSQDDLSLGRIKIVGKIGFDNGLIKFRSGSESKTGMILVYPGDLLISGINASKGAIAIYSEENDQPVAATIHYSAYEVCKDKADITYLWWFLRSGAFREILLAALSGGIKTELKPKRILPLEIALPALSDQRIILSRIEKLACRIHEVTRLRDEADHLARGTMESFIQHATDGCEKCNGHLGDVLVVNPRSGPAFVTDRDWTGTPVLMPSSVTGFGVHTSKLEFGAGNEIVSPKDRLEPGDILIARGNKRKQVGNAGIVPEEAKGWVCANLLMRTRLDQRVADSKFLIYWLRSPRMREYVGAHMSGTNPNIQKINQRTILGIPYPTSTPIEKQRRIVSQLDRLQDKMDALKKVQGETASELDVLLPSVLDKAFKGEL